LHEATLHRPLAQSGAPLRISQALPHLPQWSSETSRLTSQPSAESWLQSPKPLLQVVRSQRLRSQTLVAFIEVHWWPHIPQCEVEVARAVSQPSLLMALQSPKPLLQVSPQTPALQRAAAFCVPHAVAHAPQWSTEVSRSTQVPPQHLLAGAAHPLSSVQVPELVLLQPVTPPSTTTSATPKS
jgi:hypothetical protein